MNKKHKTVKATKATRKPQKAAKVSAGQALSVATSTKKTVMQRVAALADMPLALRENDENLSAVINLLGNKNEPAEVRMEAVQSLQTASFSVATFAPYRGEYLATLRKVAQDPNQELREAALGVLARVQDGFAQKKLIEGLQTPDKALLPPEQALQLLSYDVHADAYSVARDIVDNPPSTEARREALRLLGSDTKAAPLFEKILLDKNEVTEIRQLSASALQSLNPQKLQTHAREVVLDPNEEDDLQATCLTALTHFGDSAALAQDATLRKRVQELSDKAPKQTKQGAKQYLEKYQ